jgi:nucleoside-diphosphate-sugar epimerase
MKYFLTGATGFIGGRIARRLREQGHDVVALVRDPSKASDLRTIGVDVRQGDVTDRESLRGPMTGVDGVFHVAGWFKFDDPDPSLGERVNVEGTRNVLEVMAELGIPKGVYTSSVVVNSDTGGKIVDETFRHGGPWMSEYERTKWKAHYEVAEPMIRSGLPLVIVMPGTVYGPGDTSRIRPLFVRYLKGKLRAIPKGTAQSWSYVEDVAEGHILAMQRGMPGGTYILAGPALTLVEAFETAERITGVPAPRFHPSPRFLRAVAMITRSEWMRVAAGVTYLGSSEKAQKDLGFRSRSFETGLRETLTFEKALLENSHQPGPPTFLPSRVAVPPVGPPL